MSFVNALHQKYMQFVGAAAASVTFQAVCVVPTLQDRTLAKL